MSSKLSKGGGHQRAAPGSAKGSPHASDPKKIPRRPTNSPPTPADKKLPVVRYNSGPLVMKFEPREVGQMNLRESQQSAGEKSRPRRASIGDQEIRASIRSDVTGTSSKATEHHTTPIPRKPPNQQENKAQAPRSAVSSNRSASVQSTTNIVPHRSDNDNYVGLRGISPLPQKHNNTPPQQRSATHLPFFGSPLLPIDIVPNPSSVPLKLNLMHHNDAPTVLEKIQAMKRNELGVELVVSEPYVAITKTRSKKGMSKLHNSTSSADGRTGRNTDFSDSASTVSYDPAAHSPSSNNHPKTLMRELKVVKLLKTAGNASSATITMTGFKSGDLEQQINHDRALIVSPFFLRSHQPTKNTVMRRLMAVFDGHGEKGMVFAEHCQQSLPKLLARNLEDGFTAATASLAAGAAQVDDETTITKKSLINAFITLDETAPANLGGGCTATVVYQQGRKVYIANAGDSHSFIVVYRKQQYQSLHHVKEQQEPRPITGDPSCIKVVYRSREDKPDSPEERRRLESLGGTIFPAEKNKSARVKVVTSVPGAPLTTAISIGMSRSIGDHTFRSVGVIANPTVDAIDIPNLIQRELRCTAPSDKEPMDDVCVFAVSASDGMMILEDHDVLRISTTLAFSLFEDDGPHPLSACYNLVNDAAAVWNRRNKGKFRDDISLAVTLLRTPPAPPTALSKLHGPTSVKHKSKPGK